LKLEARLMTSPGTLGLPFLMRAGPDANGALVLEPGPPQDKMPGWRHFRQRYSEAFDSDIDLYAVFAYEAAQSILLGLRQAGSTDPDAIARAMHRLRFDGVSGPVAFNEEGDLLNPTFTLYEVQDQRWCRSRACMGCRARSCSDALGRKWRFLLEFAEVGDDAVPALGLARDAGVAAVQDQPVVRILAKFRRHELDELALDFVHILARCKAGAVGDRKMCVSTAMVGWPKAVLRTTLAVLRPTPGKASSASRDSGTSPPCSSIRMRQVSMTFLALVRYRPMVWM
jgi:hypothetical protein